MFISEATFGIEACCLSEGDSPRRLKDDRIFEAGYLGSTVVEKMRILSSSATHDAVY